MDCEACNELLAAYKRAVLLFKNAVAAEQADHLRLECEAANEALMAHWRQVHGKGNEDSAIGASL
jgi:hypothetical protein